MCRRKINGKALVLNKMLGNKKVYRCPVNDKFLLFYVRYKPVNLITIQIYFPISGYNDDVMKSVKSIIKKGTTIECNNYRTLHILFGNKKKRIKK